jgi:hypothetical protein
MNACPQCEKAYTPAFATKPEAMAKGDKVAREQWISGICSQKCWDELFGEECYKCAGEGGVEQAEGPHQVFSPCFRCAATGLLPAGSRAADEAAACAECGGAGGANVSSEDGPYFRQCRQCAGTGKRARP